MRYVFRNARQSGRNKEPGVSAFEDLKKSKTTSNQTFTMFINPVKV